jgi:hypothetical protein
MVSIVALLAAFDVLATADIIADRNGRGANAANAARVSGTFSPTP